MEATKWTVVLLCACNVAWGAVPRGGGKVFSLLPGGGPSHPMQVLRLVSRSPQDSHSPPVSSLISKGPLYHLPIPQKTATRPPKVKSQQPPPQKYYQVVGKPVYYRQSNHVEQRPIPPPSHISNYQQQQSLYQQQQLLYQQHQPVYQQHQPVYQQHQPVYQQPSYQPPQPQQLTYQQLSSMIQLEAQRQPEASHLQLVSGQPQDSSSLMTKYSFHVKHA